MFESELDRYEADLRQRVGPSAAHEARRELAAHLEADLAARLEMGISPVAARVQSLAGIGDLRAVAKAEPVALSRFSEAALLLAPSLLVIEWFLPQATNIRTHPIFVLSAMCWILWAAIRCAPARLPWIRGIAGGGTIAMIVMLLIAMTDNLIERGTFGLPRLASGSWIEALVCIPMFGLPPLLLYRVVHDLTKWRRRVRSRGGLQRV